jgi:HPt (histidine-containing phosphotransfer) domain-containing protein
VSTDRPPNEIHDLSAVLDAGCVATMHQLKLVGRLYPAFIADLPEKLAALRAAVAAVDRPAIRQLTHRLRGSAAQLGATGLARALNEIEEAAIVGSGEVVEAAGAGLDDLVRATIAALLREVERAAR